MKPFSPFPVLVIALLIAKWAMQIVLERLNRNHVLANACAVPDSFRGIIDEPTYARTVQYTLAKSRLHRFELTWNAVILSIALFSGLLPGCFYWLSRVLGSSAWAAALFLFGTGLLLTLPGLPIDWYEQFRLEERFGFNTTTPMLWWADRLKSLILAAVLGYPLLVLILKLFDWTGTGWWLCAWAVLLAFQLMMAVLAPVLILPLFNKFTPLPEGGLRERLLGLAERTGFRARSIQVMDGSKRSRHSNAFFAGFGRFRKIVLFDTLIRQITGPELEAVLAHEIGHYKRGHTRKQLAASAIISLLAFYLLSMLARAPWFYDGFGFKPGHIAPALLLFGLLSGVATFWISPLIHWCSRRYEYQADAFAAEVMHEPGSLIGALRKLNEKNLSNLTPHPLYSGFYYSHPTLLERERALLKE
jgi:STE24 endopeptidase